LNEPIKFSVSALSSSKKTDVDNGTLQYSDSQQVPKNGQIGSPPAEDSPPKIAEQVPKQSSGEDAGDFTLRKLPDSRGQRERKKSTMLNFDELALSRNDEGKDPSKETVRAFTERCS
jgi:hypothetical protein